MKDGGGRAGGIFKFIFFSCCGSRDKYAEARANPDPMPGRGHPHQTISILRRERALKRIATFAKTEMRAKTTKIIATDFLHTFREELLGTFT